MSKDIRNPQRGDWGRGFLSGGYVLLAVGVGIWIGYWAADWEVRWLPAMVRNVLVLWTLGFAFLAWGASLKAGPVSEGRSRRRSVTFAGMAIVSLIGIGAVSIASRQTPLSLLSESEFRYTHEMDARYFRDLDRNLRRLVALLEAQEELFLSRPARTLSPDEERLVLDAWRGYLDTAVALDHIRRFHEDFYGFDLSRMERVRHVRSFLLSFAAELSLYENTARIVELLDGNEHAVRFLNLEREDLSITRDSVARVREELSGLTDLSRVTAGKRYLDYLERVHQGRVDAIAERFDWLWDDVEQYIGVVEQRRSRDLVTLSASSDFAPVLRQLKHISFPVQKGIAEWMGDVRVKRIGEYLITPEQAEAMQAELEPGDVLLSRKNWYLSNIGLPGFWPHAILYVGTTEQIAQHLDDDEGVLQWVADLSGEELSLSQYLARRFPIEWRQRVERNAELGSLSVIEAVSEGVIQNSLYGASGDFIAGLRPRVSPLVKARAIVRAFTYLHRPYDFDFDFATDQALVCTEVVWRSYRSDEELAGLELTPIPVAGRLTLPANEIASTYRDESGNAEAQFDFVYYLEGKEAEARAIVSDEAAFLRTPDRGKWVIE